METTEQPSADESLVENINLLSTLCAGPVLIEVCGHQHPAEAEKLYGPGNELELPPEIFHGIVAHQRLVSVQFRLPEADGYLDVLHFDIATAVEGALEIADEAAETANDEICLPYGDGPHQKMIDWAFAQPIQCEMKMLLVAIAFHTDTDWVCRAPLSFLEERAGMAPGSAEKCLTLLLAAGSIADVAQEPFSVRLIQKTVTPERKFTH